LLPLFVDLAEFAVVIAVALTAILAKAIDGRGFIASVAVGLSIIYGGGPSWFVLVGLFFILGVAFTFYKYGYKEKLGGAQEKGGARNWPNILANGGIPSVVALWNLLDPSSLAVGVFIGAVSAAAADTAATELGLLSSATPRLITNPARKVPPGTSGGVTGLGFSGAALASAIIGATAAFLVVGGSPGGAMAAALAGGVGGACVDSLLGALVQRHGYCVICLRPTEAVSHCGEKTKKTRGSAIVENNVVNFLSTAAGGALGLLAFYAVTLA
jgi:uncharacterized protein (TIGR00297 family)